MLQVSFQHVATKRWLSDTTKTYSRPIAGQHEVACIAKREPSATWHAAEGMFLHGAEHKSTSQGSPDEL